MKKGYKEFELSTTSFEMRRQTLPLETSTRLVLTYNVLYLFIVRPSYLFLSFHTFLSLNSDLHLHPGESLPIPPLPSSSFRHTHIYTYTHTPPTIKKCLEKQETCVVFSLMCCCMSAKKTLALENLYLHVHSLFHRIPVYIDSDRNSTHTQEHSRHRSCKDRFHKETENRVNIAYNIKTHPR